VQCCVPHLPSGNEVKETAFIGPKKLGCSGLVVSMVGQLWTKQPLFLVALVVGANGLLRGRLQAPCSNSDGLAGYNFSHRGLWIPGYQLLGTGFSKQACSTECSKRSDCLAFSGAFTEDGGNGACYTYATTGGNVPSSGDRAYKKCVGVVTALPVSPVSLHLTGTKRTATTTDDLIKMAQDMEKELDGVAETMVAADQRMRRLKSMVAGAANVLTSAARKASIVSETALGNQGGLAAIARHKEHINMTFDEINMTGSRIQDLLKKIKSRIPAAPAAGAAPTTLAVASGPTLAALIPNVTRVESNITLLNDPATADKINSVATLYNSFKANITDTVKLVVRNHIRAHVDHLREAYANYTDSFKPVKKDPCCCK